MSYSFNILVGWAETEVAMARKAQVWTVKNQDLGDVNSLIDFLEWAREMLKTREDAELVVHFNPGDDALEYELLGGRDGPIRRIRLGVHTY